MISQFLDILFILLSVFGYFGGFYDAFELTLPFFMMLLVMLLSLIFYYFWKLDKKIQKITLIVILAVTIISIPIWFNGAKSFIGLIINYYSYRDIHVSIVSWQVNTASTSYFLFLLLINIYVVLIMTHYYQARKHLLLHYLPAILYLFIPVLYQYIPEYYYLTALIGVVLTLYLSRYINQQHDQWIKIISLILIGVVTFALPQIYPTNSYERLFTLDYVKEKINSISNEMVDADEIKPTRVDLSEVSTINPSDAVELYIQTDNSTSFKLKEQDYTTYRSTSWTKTDTTSENRLNQIRLDQLSLLEGTSSALTITNGDGKALNERYTPYYTKTHEDGEFEIMLYTDLSLTSLLELPVNDELIEYEEEMESTYLNYPTYLENLLRGAVSTAGVTSSDDVAAIVDKVVTYLDENFTYTYQAAKPEEDQDFVVAFYRSGKGYCIHFATFATLLLRYSGIMARYVEGYQVRSYDETINTFIVTKEDAHAWVEIFIDTVGWIPIEVTPVSVESQSINITIDNSEIDTNLEENPNEEMINEEQQTNNEQQQENNNVAEVIEEQEENRIPNSVFYILGIVLIVVFIHILSMLNKWRYQHQSNSQYVLYLYHLLDLLHIEVDEEYYQLALKARYANVPIEDTEAKDYEQYYHRAITKHVQLQPWYKKLVIRWLFP